MFGVLITVDPLLYVDEAGSIVDLEGVIRGLRCDRVDLSDEGELEDWSVCRSALRDIG